MTKIEQVVAYLRDNGPTKPDDMLPHVGMSKQQVHDALGNGALRDRCHVQQRIRQPGTRGGVVSLWAYGPGPNREKHEQEGKLPTITAPRGEYAWIGPVSSVWDLSLRA